jgi:FkbM family methyltransferase
MKIYIEAGANNGLEQSRSLDFRDNEEYFGILIEPDSDAFASCVHNRNNGRTAFKNVALVGDKYSSPTIKLNKHNASLMNSVNQCQGIDYEGVMYCEAVTLKSILAEMGIKEVEYFFLDVEGFEHNVLSGVDFSQVVFKNIEVESHYPFLGVSFEDDKKRFVDFFSSNGYYMVSEQIGDGLPKLTFKPNG